MLFLPPRHGKSEMTTVRYPVWRLEREPEMSIIVSAYGQGLAQKFSRKSRGIAGRRFALSTERAAASDWETEKGGSVRSVGVGGGITGHGGDLIIIDDPVKNREEANSEAYRDRCWEWYQDDLSTRLEPGGAMILIMTRWHMDDLAGRILGGDEASDWEVLTLPALAEENDPLGRAVGEALCPERYDAEWLHAARDRMHRSFAALYQQRPQPLEGNAYKREWFEILPALPSEMKSFTRYWDKAGTAAGGDYTAGVLMGRKDKTYYIVDVIRGQWSASEREGIIKQTAITDKLQYGRVRIWVEQEPGSGGMESAENTIKNLAGHTAGADIPRGDKVLRSEPLESQARVGNVKLIVGRWNKTFLDELTVFPSGANDDQVDAASGAFSKLHRKGSFFG